MLVVPAAIAAAFVPKPAASDVLAFRAPPALQVPVAGYPELPSMFPPYSNPLVKLPLTSAAI